jgi:hypothetical protein
MPAIKGLGEARGKEAASADDACARRPLLASAAFSPPASCQPGAPVRDLPGGLDTGQPFARRH